jgi:DNA repair protein RadA/Sms
MAKSKTNYVCNSCGESYAKWSGKCDNCGNWNTLVEFKEAKIRGKAAGGEKLKAQKLKDVSFPTTNDRYKTGIAPADEVLGGGIVPASVVLLAGEPGIGKSTILLQMAAALAKNHRVLYVSGEESVNQIKLRAERLGVGSEDLELAASTSANDISSTMSSDDYDLVIVDSIQTVSVAEVDSSAGSVSQITNCSQLLQATAKKAGTALMMIGHVTKEGSIAGPKILEHLVDVVLYLEGDRYGGFKVLRGVKNRFGSTNEVGLFEMANEGMIAVDNPSAALLAERQTSDGSVVLATMEGTRAMLVEVQALVSKSSFGYPKRTAVGIDPNRLNLLIAVLNQRTKLNLSEHDVYVNIVGGIKITEPAADLAVCMAVASAAKGMQLKSDAVVFGEVGLSGEVRRVNNIDKRISEAQKLGFKNAIAPKSGKNDKFVIPVATLRDGLNQFLSK